VEKHKSIGTICIFCNNYVEGPDEKVYNSRMLVDRSPPSNSTIFGSNP
jgi:hypothetical protein